MDRPKGMKPMSVTKPTPEMPVLIVGVRDGEIIAQSQWERGYAPKQEFANLAEAQKAFPDLNLDCTDNPRFAGAVVQYRKGEAWARFDTREYYNWITEG